MTTATIRFSRSFKRDYKRELKTHGENLKAIFDDFLLSLTTEGPLPRKYYDHQLSGDKNRLRECHLKPDLLVVYSAVKTGEGNTLYLIMGIGSHSELFT